MRQTCLPRARDVNPRLPEQFFCNKSTEGGGGGYHPALDFRY